MDGDSQRVKATRKRASPQSGDEPKVKKPKVVKPKSDKLVKERVPKVVDHGPKVRSWMVTINNYTQVDEEQLKGLVGTLDAKYVVYGYEVAPTTGTPHLQAWVYFSNARHMGGVKKLLPRANLLKTEAVYLPHSIGYCKKGNLTDAEKPTEAEGGWSKFYEKAHESFTGYEDGVLPKIPKAKGQMEVERYQVAWDLAKEGKIEEIDADIRLRLYGTLKRIKADYLPKPVRLLAHDNHWYEGISGTGKSHTAREGYIEDEIYTKTLTKWWDGYVGQPLVLIEEWHPKLDVELQQLLKLWSDLYPFDAEFKGGTFKIRPAKLIITANYSMRTCFGHDEQGLLAPLSRRFKVRAFTEVYEPPVAPVEELTEFSEVDGPAVVSPGALV